MKPAKIFLAMFAIAAFSVFVASASAVSCDFDEVCETGESILWCPSDCHAAGYCGDGFCDANEQGNCAEDCPPANCTPTNGGTEICDGIDNNCDGLIDEGLSLICSWEPANGVLSTSSTASQTFNMRISNPGNASLEIKWYDNGELSQTDGTDYIFTANPDLTGAHTINVSVKNLVSNATSTKQWQLGVNTSSWVKFWGKVTDSETGLPLAGEKISFYQDTGIAGKYGNVTELETYTYDTWKTLAPKSTPDTMTDANGYFYTDLANGIYNYVIQGSREDEMEVKVGGSGSRDSSVSRTKIVLPRTGYVKVYFESASAGLKSDLYMNWTTPILMVANSTVGASYVTSGTYANGTELKFYIRVHAQSWGLGEYNHWSDSQYAKVEQLDSDTWRIYFEDLPSNQADWDFNDVVALVDLIDTQNPSIPPVDCDSDGNPNWNDTNDNWCDIGDIIANQTKFDADGHILYSGGNYSGSNNYTCGQKIRFVMFGTNNGTANETITFAVQDHTSNENPDAPMLYEGSASNPDESLTVPANSTAEKRFDWQIPCNGTDEGKYDIHIVWDSNSLWRKIGDFYVVADETDPQIGVAIGPFQAFPNQTITVGYSAGDLPQEGTMPDLVAQIQGISGTPDASVTIEVNKDVVNYPGVVDISAFGGNQEINLSYPSSGYYTARFTATDLSGNSVFEDRNITVWITEAEAKAIGQPIWADYLNISGGRNPWYDSSCQDGTNDIKLNCDRWDDGLTIGEEYIGETLTNPNGDYDENVTDVAGTNSSWMIKDGKDTVLNGRVDTCGTAPYTKVIYPSGPNEYAQTLSDYLRHLKCDPGCGIALAGPAC